MHLLSKRAKALLLVFVWVALSPAARAQEEDSAAADFNPFPAGAEELPQSRPIEKAPSRASARISDDPAEEESGFPLKLPALPKPKLPALPKPTLPKLTLPSWTTTREMPREGMRQPPEPSTWQKFSSTTKDMFSKTKETLMPWANDESDPESARRGNSPPRRSPPRSTSRSKARKASGEKKSFFPWFNSEPEKDDPFKDGVNGFLAQPRPE